MKNDDLFEALTGIDPDLIEAAAPKARKAPQRGVGILKWGALAASVLLVLMILPTVLFLIPDHTPAVPIGTAPIGTAHESDPLSSDPQESESISPPREEIDPALIVYGEQLTGMQEQAIVNGSIEGGPAAEMIAPEFYIHTVVEVQVLEVFTDTYYVSDSTQNYRVARLRVLDRIRGEGIPDEIYLLYPFYDSYVLDGFDTLILSLSQEGIENFAMIGKESHTVQYFPNMFEIVRTRDLGYGSAIAFRDGVVDPRLWERCTNYTTATYLLDEPSYPASHGSTVGEVKEQIRATIAEKNDGWYVSSYGYDYVTAEDLFLTEEQKALVPYLAPSSVSTFRQSISIYRDRVAATYERYVNGFATGEQIWLNFEYKGKIEKNETHYTGEEISRLPDIGSAIALLDPSSLTPPHIELSQTESLLSLRISGVYRKVDGKLYGIVKVFWTCRYRGEDAGTYIRDDCYFLYDESGNGQQIERDALNALLGEYASGVTASFDYLPFWVDPI
jgi:hypothetical protein